MIQKERIMSLGFISGMLLISLTFLVSSFVALEFEVAVTPILISSILLLLSTTIVIKEIRLLKKPVIQDEHNAEGEQQSNGRNKPWWWMLGLAVIYYILIITIGFFISTFLFLVITPYLYQYKNWKVTLLSSLIFMMIYWVGFEILMGLRFPNGILFS